MTVTQTSKTHYGWQSESTVDIGNGRALQILTMKRHSGAIVTSATCVKPERGGYSFMMGSDFNKSYKSTKNRCTEKNVVEQHNAVVADVDQIKADCEAFYKNA